MMASLSWVHGLRRAAGVDLHCLPVRSRSPGTPDSRGPSRPCVLGRPGRARRSSCTRRNAWPATARRSRASSARRWLASGFLSVWSARSLAELVDKIEKTMPPQQPGSVSRQQAIDLAAYVLARRQIPGRADRPRLGRAGTDRISGGASVSRPSSAGASSFAVAGNLAQLMRGVTFPNANILFNVQVKDPGKEKPAMPMPFDYVVWGSTVYYGWQAVDQAALALVETAPLFLLPGRRCENGRPVPIDRADWKQYTDGAHGRRTGGLPAAQTRNADAVVKVADQLNESCANCHKVYRDGAREGNTAGATRCQ